MVSSRLADVFLQEGGLSDPPLASGFLHEDVFGGPHRNAAGCKRCTLVITSRLAGVFLQERVAGDAALQAVRLPARSHLW